MGLLSALPAQVMAELKTACRASPPPSGPNGPATHIKPAAVASLRLVPEGGPGADARKGALLVDVYIWRSAGVGRT